jgi:2-methylcitrate dehydratase PrpD
MPKESGANMTANIVRFIKDLKFDKLPADVVKQAKHSIIDLIGCLLAGVAVTDHAKILLEVMKEMEGRPEATIFGDGFKTTNVNAALINGTSAHSLDLDDTHRECFFHVGSPVIPGVLALAEKEGRSGKDIITAVVAAYEVSVRIALAVNPALRLNGFHTTALCGTFGSAVGAGKMLGLNEEQLVNTLGLAGTQAAGMFQFIEDGDMSKRLHAGKAAFNGVLSALLARKGYTGPHGVLEGRYAFPAVFAREYKPEIMTEGLGKKYRIMEMGTKIHAACRYTNTSIDAALMLVEKYDFKPADVKEGKIRVCKMAADQLKKQDVKTFLDGQLSGPFSVALAIAHKQAGYNDFMQGVQEQTVLELTKKIRTAEEPRLGLTDRTAIVDITTKDGKTYSQEVKLAKGEPEVPLSQEDIECKFRDLASCSLENNKVERALELLNDLENLNDFSYLVKYLVP